MHARDDLSCTRGYELFILKEARKRNPYVKTYGLSWGAPNWINNGSYFGSDMVNYQTQWVACMEGEGVTIDYLVSCSAEAQRHTVSAPILLSFTPKKKNTPGRME